MVVLGDYAFKDCTDNGGMALPKLVGYIGESEFSGWTDLQAIKTYEGQEEVLSMLSTGLFKGCAATIYDKDFNILVIDPETGLVKTT